MIVFLGLFSIFIFIVLIVGLIKLGIILKWDNKLIRFKVFGYWILFLVVIGVLGVIIIDEEEVVRIRIVVVNSYIEKKEYDLVKFSLDLIKVENKYYLEV